MQRFFFYSGIVVALVLRLVAFAASFGAANAQEVPEPMSIPVHHEISGARFAYQVGENDSSDSIAARFGEPELTLFPDGSKPEPGGAITRSSAVRFEPRPADYESAAAFISTSELPTKTPAFLPNQSHVRVAL